LKTDHERSTSSRFLTESLPSGRDLLDKHKEKVLKVSNELQDL